MNVRIIDIAKAANFSPSTVSFVLNGRGDEFGIAIKTQEHIMKVARDIGYRPNISAKKLRHSDGQSVPSITVFFAINPYLSRIPEVMMGLHKSILKNGVAADVNFKPYVDGSLHKEFNTSHSNLFNGAIVAGAFDGDIEAIEKMTILTPIVLLNRNSDIFNSVYCDSYKLGYSVAELFKKRGHQNVGMVSLENSYYTLDLRIKGFLAGCEDNELAIAPQNLLRAPSSFAGGDATTCKIIEGGIMPTAIFYLHNVLAVGAISAFKRYQIRVPQDIEIITYGDNEYLEYTDPRISAVYSPIDDITCAAIDLLVQIINSGTNSRVQEKLDSLMVIRDSCGG